MKQQLGTIREIHAKTDKCGTPPVSCLRPATAATAVKIASQSINAVAVVEPPNERTSYATHHGDRNEIFQEMMAAARRRSAKLERRRRLCPGRFRKMAIQITEIAQNVAKYKLDNSERYSPQPASS